MPPQRRAKTTTEKGLGHAHREVRKQLLRNHVDGTLCAHCGKPMFKWQALDADHELARSRGGKKANRLLHAGCNRSRKDGTGGPAPALLQARSERSKWTLLDWG